MDDFTCELCYKKCYILFDFFIKTEASWSRKKICKKCATTSQIADTTPHKGDINDE